jgi:hypothetical protein
VLILTGVAHRPAPAASQRRVLTPRHDNPSMRDSASRGINQGFTRVRPSDLPLARSQRMERQPSGFAPSFAPRPYGPRTSRWGQVIKHGPEPTLYVIDLASDPALISQYVRPHVARDNAEV